MCAKNSSVLNIVCWKSYLPEPHDLLAVAGIVAIDCALLPLSDMKLLHPAQHELQLSLVKELEPVERNDLIEAVQEGLCLLLHPSLEPPLTHHPGGREGERRMSR